MHPLDKRVLAHIRRQELLRAGDRVGVAVSGGSDSVALLRLLIELRAELGIVVSVAHFNHKLRGAESDGDEQFVAKLAREYDLEFYCDSDDVAGHAREEGITVEAAARELRYGFFHYLIGEGRDADRQGLKPVVQRNAALRGPEGALFHGDGQNGEPPAGAAESRPLSKTGTPARFTAEAVPFPNPIAALASKTALNKIATGHTLDDQAETVLMRLIRGTGLRGLGGIHPRILIDPDDADHHPGVHGEIVRPLLEVRRRELQQYLKDLDQPWREDSSNADAKFTRNRVRQIVLPLLEREFNPVIAENLAELADIARGEEDYWENEISGWLGTVVQWSQPKWAEEMEQAQSLVQIQLSGGHADGSQPQNPADEDQPSQPEYEDAADASVSRAWLLTEPVAVQRRLVKAIGENAGIPLEFRNIEEILRFAEENGPCGKELSLPRGWRVVREAEAIVFLAPDPRAAESVARDYEYPLPVPGRVVVPEAGIVIEALLLPAKSQPREYNPQQLLTAAMLPAQLTLRNWRPGDRFWPAHTKAPRKIKELLQERHVAQPERRLWPVVVSGDEIVWMRGFPVPARFRAKPEEDAVLIRETGWVEEQRI